MRANLDTEFWSLWPNGPPDIAPASLARDVVDRSGDPHLPDRFVRGVVDPGLWVLRPKQPSGALILLIPGGGYRGQALDKEGLECALPFVEAGVMAFVLEHRLPGDGWSSGIETALADARQAVAVLRSHADLHGLDPRRLAVWGASAGGHLAGLLARGPVATRPDVLFLAYPLVALGGPFSNAGCREALLGATPNPDEVARWSLDHGDWPQAPPTWIMHATDDSVIPVGASLALAERLTRAGHGADLHLFDRGGHGFGIRTRIGSPAHAWPDLAIAFGRRRGWLAS